MMIGDLHCDLLSYLAKKKLREAENPEARCSIPQLKEGKVSLQTLAIFTETGKDSVKKAALQSTIFQKLPHVYPDDVVHLNKLQFPEEKEKIHLVASIENASGLLGEEEELEKAFTRLERMQEQMGPILYISLTWHHENRFGGGNASKVGLKEDGKHFLEYLSGKKIAIDLSHTSDALAEGILEYREKKNLQLNPIASHSNFRKIIDHKRNLPDEIAKEIFRQKGVVGLNLVKYFVGKNLPDDLIRHIEHGKELGGSDYLCFGADFFYDKDLSYALHPFLPLFTPPFSDASCYPTILQHLKGIEKEKLAYLNLKHFLQRNEA